MYKKYLVLISFFMIVILATLFFADAKINSETNNLVYNNPDIIPHNKVGLLLGTSKTLSNGNENLYFKNRIKATIDLFFKNKIDYIVISGDNSKVDYNEPMEMKNELIKNGIPSEKIYLDFAGFRTFDSILRIYKIFGQTKFTVISQEFHNRRAIYIAKRNKLFAIGFNAKNVDNYTGFKTNIREKFARIKMLIDLKFGVKPKFLGEKINIK